MKYEKPKKKSSGIVFPVEILEELPLKQGWYYYNYEEEDLCLLLFMFLHKSNLIDRQSYLERCKQYYNHTLIRKVNTFKMKVKHNVCWINDGNTVEAYRDAYSTFKHDLVDSISLEEAVILCDSIVSRINKNFDGGYLNTKEFLLDKFVVHLFKYLVAEMYSDYRIEYVQDLLHKMGFKFDSIRKDEVYVGSWCCEDCDGPYEHAVAYRYGSELSGLRKKLQQDVDKIVAS